MVHRQGATRAVVPSKSAGARARVERHVRAGGPLGMAYPSPRSDARCDGRSRLREKLGRSRRGDPPRGCGLVPAGRETLARGHADPPDDAHRHPGGTRRQRRQLDGGGQRRTVPASSRSERGQSHMSAFNGWENFYVIVGSSAGALIGLQFVVVTLIAGRPIGRAEAQAGRAFATPSVVHFGVVLLLSAMVSAPWDGVTIVATLWGIVGLGGVVYVVLVSRRMRSQGAYQPVFEDWCFHVLLPLRRTPFWPS